MSQQIKKYQYGLIVMPRTWDEDGSSMRVLRRRARKLAGAIHKLVPTVVITDVLYKVGAVIIQDDSEKALTAARVVLKKHFVQDDYVLCITRSDKK